MCLQRLWIDLFDQVELLLVEYYLRATGWLGCVSSFGGTGSLIVFLAICTLRCGVRRHNHHFVQRENVSFKFLRREILEDGLEQLKVLPGRLTSQ